MGVEVERKFLVDLQKIGKLENGAAIKQGYIPTGNKVAVRVRLKGNEAFLTLKGANKGATRSEYEYLIPVADAEAILGELCSGPVVTKTRYLKENAGHTWEIDVFHGENDGLIVAEVELEKEDEVVTLPDWAIEEVTGDAKYYNSNLLGHPFSKWRDDD